MAGENSLLKRICISLSTRECLNVLKEIVNMKEEIVIVRILFKIFNVLELLTSLQKRK